EEGRSKLQDLEQVYYGVQGSTTLRAAFPKELVGKRDAPVDVVVALHAAGGSENMFFEAYGRGIAVSEAIKRGWVFIAPRNSRTAVQDAVDWLQDARGLKVRNLFVIGHSSGGGAALGSYETKPAPTAFGLFAPALATVPQSVFQAPIYLSIGKQDTGRLYGSASSIGREMGNRPTFRYQEFDPCEHLMLVAESIPGAYAFFEKISR
ncbi:MAG TPA: hypothetical protein VEX38_05185, partial [Fimbriimonadaceae bacterium]|nr:hypothetical protein [Fimbriimonadaceae bacterium]